MARSSTERARPGGGLWRRPLLLGVWFSALLHGAVIGWLCGAREPVQRVLAKPRGVSVQWVRPIAPMHAAGCVQAPCGSGFSRDSQPFASPSRLKPLPQEKSRHMALAQASPAPGAEAASALPATEAASAPSVGIDWAPARLSGFASRWGRALVHGPAEDDETLRLARQQSIRMAAQQRQAMVELAWRTQAAAMAVAPPAPAVMSVPAPDPE